MNDVFEKAKRNVLLLLLNFKKDKYFSIRFAFLGFFLSAFSKLRFKRLSKSLQNKRNLWIDDYLDTLLQKTVKKYKNINDLGHANIDKYIWVCWWSGYDTAPELVKKCIVSIKKHTTNYKCIFIDENNYSDYISIPEYILEKVNNGSMCIANFSDYLRVSLIEKYGGFWIDATIFMIKDLPDNYFCYPLFTCKNEYKDIGYISMFRWTSFFIGGWQHNVFFSFMKSAFEEYWSKADISIDYLLVDYLINYAYNNIEVIRDLIDNVPINNQNKDELQAAFNNRLDAVTLDEILASGDVFFKLSWREIYSLKTTAGAESLYSRFINCNYEV